MARPSSTSWPATATRSRRIPGGGPFNAARTIARLDQPVAYLGRLSTDRCGDRLERILLDDGVSLESVVRTEDPTTLALAELGDGGSVSRYRFYTQGTSAAGLTSEAALVALPERVATLFVGTLGLVLEPMASGSRPSSTASRAATRWSSSTRTAAPT